MCFLTEDRGLCRQETSRTAAHNFSDPSLTKSISHWRHLWGLKCFFIEIPKPNTSYALLTRRYTFWSSSCKGGRKLRTKPTEDQNNLSNQQKQSHILALNRCGIISPSLKSRCNKMSTSWLAGASLPQFHVIAVFHQAEQNSSWPADWSVLPF